MSESVLSERTVATLTICPIRVLHVDDDVALLAMAKQCLELQSDIKVKSANSVEEALELLKLKSFDVIVSDYQMPNEDGLEFLAKIKASGIATPFILFSGKGRDEVAVKALGLGAFRCVDKGGDPEAAYAELSSCLRQANDYAKAQDLLRESEKRFRAVFDSSIDAILVVNDLGDIVYSNKAAKMLDYSRDKIAQALNEYFNKQFTAVYEQNMLDGFQQLSNGKLLMAGKTIELALERSSGDTFSVELSFSAFMENGQWFGVSIIRDISERKKQEQALEESRQTLKALFEYNPEAIVFTDKEYRVTEVNRSFTELFGFSYEEIKGKNIMGVIVPESHKKETDFLLDLITKGPVSFSTKRKRVDGSVFDVAMSGGPLVVNGQTTGLFMVYVNISDIVTVQKLLEESLAKAKLLNEKISVLGGFTRHDIRNKLGLIQGNLYLARKTCEVSSVLENYLHNIDDAIKACTAILDFAKTYEMLGVEDAGPKDLGKMVQNAILLFSDLKGIKVNNQCVGIEVIADSLLTEVFYNLVDNTLKYGEKTTTITVCAEVRDQSLHMFYKDDGVGVDSKYKQRLFQKGFGKGTGLGLYLTHKISELYGWTLKETGKPGEGAQFEFAIPLKKVKKLGDGSQPK